MKPSQLFFCFFLTKLVFCTYYGNVSVCGSGLLSTQKKKRLKDTSVLTWIHKVTYPVQCFIYNASDPQLSETLVA